MHTAYIICAIVKTSFLFRDFPVKGAGYIMISEWIMIIIKGSWDVKTSELRTNRKWWRVVVQYNTLQGGRVVITKGSGDEGKWWWRGVVTKGSGEEGKWWWRGVVTKGSGDEGKWWRREVVTKGSGEEGKWWWRGVVKKGSDDEGEW